MYCDEYVGSKVA